MLKITEAIRSAGLDPADYEIVAEVEGLGTPDGTAANERILLETSSWRIVAILTRHPLIVIVYKA